MLVVWRFEFVMVTLVIVVVSEAVRQSDVLIVVAVLAPPSGSVRVLASKRVDAAPLPLSSGSH